MSARKRDEGIDVGQSSNVKRFARHVRYRHLADMRCCTEHVCFFDPKRTLQSGKKPLVVGLDSAVALASALL